LRIWIILTKFQKNKIGIWPNGLAPWSGPYGLVRPGRFRSSEDPTGPWTPRRSPSPPFSPPLALEPRERRRIATFSRPLPALSGTGEVVLGSALMCYITSPSSIWSFWPLSPAPNSASSELLWPAPVASATSSTSVRWRGSPRTYLPIAASLRSPSMLSWPRRRLTLADVVRARRYSYGCRASGVTPALIRPTLEVTCCCSDVVVLVDPSPSTPVGWSGLDHYSAVTVS
jgi:hypothetical protein